jgi:vanillate O-demethylase monooxygenase subunit
MFLRNHWYVACTPAEIDDKPLGRTVCNERIVFYRGPEGQAVALEDWCPHRGAPLSLGHGGRRQAGVRLPRPGDGLRRQDGGHARPARGGFPAIRSFPVVERHGFIWVWPGDEALADPALIPDLHWERQPGLGRRRRAVPGHCDYRLMVDNLMDLTHETYVHGGSIGQTGRSTRHPRHHPRRRRPPSPERFMNGITPPPFWPMADARHALPTTSRWTAGRSAASRRPAT